MRDQKIASGQVVVVSVVSEVVLVVPREGPVELRRVLLLLCCCCLCCCFCTDLLFFGLLCSRLPPVLHSTVIDECGRLI